MAKKKTIKDATIASEEEIKVTEEVEEELEDIEEEFDDLDEESYEDYDEYDSEKETKNKKKKEVKEKEEKEKKETKKKATKEKKGGFFSQVNKEMKKVVWPKGSEIAKNTITVIVFIIVLCLFFEAIELLAAFIKGLFV